MELSKIIECIKTETDLTKDKMNEYKLLTQREITNNDINGTKISIKHLIEISDFLSISFDELIGRKDFINPEIIVDETQKAYHAVRIDEDCKSVAIEFPSLNDHDKEIVFTIMRRMKLDEEFEKNDKLRNTRRISNV